MAKKQTTTTTTTTASQLLASAATEENKFFGTIGERNTAIALAMAAEKKPLLVVCIEAAEIMGALDAWPEGKDGKRTMAPVTMAPKESPLAPFKRFAAWLSQAAPEGKTFICEGMCQLDSKGALKAFPKVKRAPSQPKAGSKEAEEKTKVKAGAPANPERVALPADKAGIIKAALAAVDALRPLYARKTDLSVIGQISDLLNDLLDDTDI